MSLELSQKHPDSAKLLKEFAAPYWAALRRQSVILKPYFPSPATIRRAKELFEESSTPAHIREAATKLLSRFLLLPTQNEDREAVFWRGQVSPLQNTRFYLSAEGEICHFSEDDPDAKAEPVTRDSAMVVLKGQFLIPGSYPAEFVGSAWRKLTLAVNSK